MTKRKRSSPADEQRFVERLDYEGCKRVRALIHARWTTLEREASQARRAAAEQPPRRPRGRPTRIIERSAIVAALAKHDGSARSAARALSVPKTTLARHARALQIPDWAWAYGPAVLEEHAKLLMQSGVLPEVARLRAYESAVQTSSARGGLLVPVWGVHGRRAWSQIRHDAPRAHRWRYENSPDAHAIVDVSPAARARVLDPQQPLYVTESPRKADAAVSLGLACVDFPGIRMLCLDDETWDYIGVHDRDVRIVFDADAGTKPDVGAAEWWLAEYLTSKGARVTVYRLPLGQGLDDYLASGRHLDDLPEVELPTQPPVVVVPWWIRRPTNTPWARRRRE